MGAAAVAVRWLWATGGGGSSSSLQTQDGRPDQLRPTFPHGAPRWQPGHSGRRQWAGGGVSSTSRPLPPAHHGVVWVFSCGSRPQTHRKVVGISLGGGRVYRMMSITPYRLVDGAG